MPKKIKFEAFKYRFLIEAAEFRMQPKVATHLPWGEFINELTFTYQAGDILITWSRPQAGEWLVPGRQAQFYTRGDSEAHARKQGEAGLLSTEDPVKLQNQQYFHAALMDVAQAAGYEPSHSATARLEVEREFHDAWAESEDIDAIDVRGSNEVCTAPEMRYITARLGNLRGKRLLDVGCGLGEASVYFAMQGADVTSSDLSQGMLDAASRLAAKNGVSVRQHLASAEDMRLPADARFDVIYAGNLLHHVDIDATLRRIRPHLADDGVLVTWDPLAYNPAINVYRTMAMDVRTPDEHPLTWRDIRSFSQHFSRVETRYFWFTTLIIFVIMALAQRRDPNKERFWKVILKEGPKWAWLYRPLELLDKALLFLIPPLRLLCWNVVIVARK
jgi:SAM-dependent methyltransferase